jgi:hypothetical protein
MAAHERVDNEDIDLAGDDLGHKTIDNWLDNDSPVTRRPGNNELLVATAVNQKTVADIVRLQLVYFYALRTRKSAGLMTRKLSVTESQ